MARHTNEQEDLFATSPDEIAFIKKKRIFK
jgi:hypothetical protein